MNDKLTIQELSAYLPYGVKFMPTHFNIEKKSDTLYYLTTIHNSEEFGVNGYTSKYIKPILYPLSSLTKEIEHKGEKFVPIEILKREFWKSLDIYQPSSHNIEINIETQNYSQSIDLFDGYLITQRLAEWHIDFQNLIPRQLAVDKTTIQ